MKIQSISIVPETVGCPAGCKYCISRMTKTPKNGKKIDFKKLSNALQYARSGDAQTAILTSKGETLESDWNYLGEILKETKAHGFGQRDLHSNMYGVLERKKEFYEKLIKPEYGLTNVTITAASMDPETSKEIMGIDMDYQGLFKYLNEDCDITIRLSCVMNKQGVHDKETIEDYINKAKKAGAHQIVFRGLWIPDNRKENGVSLWSNQNYVGVEAAEKALEELVEEGKAHKIFQLPWGATVYDVQGMNITAATCNINYFSESIKSVVYLPNNHLYSSWEFEGSRIM